MSQPITVKDVKVILTQPTGPRLVVVKVITSEPGLYGLGCATFTQRFRAVQAAIEQHLKPFLIGRDVNRIEEIWQVAMVNGYWRNGPVLNNAISGIDQALWDIKGKLANMPIYQLLGGKCREAASVYVHANGHNHQELAEIIQQYTEQGFRTIRLQFIDTGEKSARINRPEGAQPGNYFDPRSYCRTVLKMIEWVRCTFGEEIELVYDVHERLSPIDTLGFAKDVERFKLFFLEDSLAPEDIHWYQHIRSQCATPLAMGELLNNPHEWRFLIENRLIDFIRMHISQMGGITPARNAAIAAQSYGIRTAWHGPPDVSPVGHAANLQLDLWSPNFGIQEWTCFPDLVYEMFPGTPEVRDGYLYPNEKPGLGIDIDEKLAAKFPVTDIVETWTQTRLPDGSPTRP